jgi:hypothetical protein
METRSSIDVVERREQGSMNGPCMCDENVLCFQPEILERILTCRRLNDDEHEPQRLGSVSGPVQEKDSDDVKLDGLSSRVSPIRRGRFLVWPVVEAGSKSCPPTSTPMVAATD